MSEVDTWIHTMKEIETHRKRKVWFILDDFQQFERVASAVRALTDAKIYSEEIWSFD